MDDALESKYGHNWETVLASKYGADYIYQLESELQQITVNQSQMFENNNGLDDDCDNEQDNDDLDDDQDDCDNDQDDFYDRD